MYPKIPKALLGCVTPPELGSTPVATPQFMVPLLDPSLGVRFLGSCLTFFYFFRYLSFVVNRFFVLFGVGLLGSMVVGSSARTCLQILSESIWTC